MGSEASPYIGLVARSLQDNDPVIRRISADSIGRMGVVAAPEAAALVTALDDTDEVVRRRVAKVLGMMCAASVAHLIHHLDDADIKVRKKAAQSLGAMGSGLALRRCLKDSDAGVRAQAVQALGNMGTLAAPHAMELGRGLRDKDRAVRYYSKVAVRNVMPRRNGSWRHNKEQLDCALNRLTTLCE